MLEYSGRRWPLRRRFALLAALAVLVTDQGRLRLQADHARFPFQAERAGADFRLTSEAAQRSRNDPEITDTALGAAMLAAEDNRAPTPGELSAILEGTRSGIESLQLASIRALGRLERRDVVPYLLPFLHSEKSAVRAAGAFAMAQAMRGERLTADSGGEQVEGVLTALLAAAGTESTPGGIAMLAHSLARLPCTSAEQVQRIETMLASMLRLSKALSVRIEGAADAETVMAGALRGLEMLPRLQRTLYAPDETTLDLLRGHASGRSSVGWAGVGEAIRPAAFYAAVSSRVVDAETLRPNLSGGRDPMLRRAAMALLGGAGSPIDGLERAELIRSGLNDPEHVVRLEAVRGYARHQAKADGCLPLIQMRGDRSEHVALAAIDALGDSCAGDEGALMTLVAEARTPPNAGSWRREAHALVALAKRSRGHLTIPLVSHSRHNTWQVRMYAAQAAAIADDVLTLERLALDDHDNVRNATLAPLKRLKGTDAERFFLAALGRSDYQLLRTAAREAAGFPATRAMGDALLEALLRITAQKRETSRDARLALLERLGEFGSERHVDRLKPLLRDFDWRVADAAASTLDALTGEVPAVDPQPLPRQPLPSPEELRFLREHTAVLQMEGSRDIRIGLDVDLAPLTSTRFLRLARAGYFDGLTFHRIVPNFIVQGGSPGANEYMGDGPYLRDEISARTHARGTIGLSTRGRDTGDAQLFINLVPNPRLDFEYTIFGAVSATSLREIDEIGEGDRITKVGFVRRTKD